MFLKTELEIVNHEKLSEICSSQERQLI